MMPQESAIDIIRHTKGFDHLMVVAEANEKETFEFFAKLIHPDICDHPDATAMFQKLTELRDSYTKGVKLEDQAGEYFATTKWIKRTLTEENESLLLNNVRKVSSIMRNCDGGIMDYLPKTIGVDKCAFERRAIALCQIPSLDQVHVNWILSRMLEFITWLNNNTKGYVHCGISPDSIFITPENHGIIVTSFYNLTKIDGAVTNIDGKYRTWYPPQLFKYKTANSMVDIEMAKKTAIWLLGDKSGVGNSLKRTHNKDFMNFVTKQHTNPYEAYAEYREILSKNFKKEFHILDI